MASRTTNDETVDVNNLKGDVDALRKDLVALREHLHEFGRDGVVSARASGEAVYGDIRKELDELIGEASQQARRARGEVEGQIRERPLMSLMAAFGIGMLISQFMGGRQR